MVDSTEQKLNWSRKKSVTFLSVIGCALSLIFTTGISSYLLGVVDTFVNEFGIMFLIVIQCIIFTWLYDVDLLIAKLHENNRFKIGRTWKLIVKYVLPCFLMLIWLIGIYDLFIGINTFEMMVYIVIMILVLLFSGILTKIKG